MSTPAPTSSPSSRRPTIAVLAALGLLVAARAWFLIAPDTSWWGINLAQYLDPTLAWILVVASIAFIGWSMVAREQRATKKSAAWPWWYTALIVVPSGVAFWFFAPPYTFLGDSTMYAGELWRFFKFGEHVHLHKEPIPMLLAEGVFWLQLKLKISTLAHTTYVITGAGCGMVFVWISLRLARMLFADTLYRVLAIVLLLSCGGTVLFFGYMETYAVPYVMTLAYCAAGIGFTQRRATVRTVALLLGLSLLGHFQNVLLIPSFGVLLLWHYRRETFARTTYTALAIVFPLLFAIYLAIAFVPQLQALVGAKTFIPLHASATGTYTLFSSRHLLDLVNEHLLVAAVPCLVILALALFYRNGIDWSAPEVVFLATVGIFLEAFLVGGFFDLGLARDWDVVSALGIVYALLTLVMFRQLSRAGANLHGIATGVAGAAATGVIAWVVVNASMPSAIQRYTDLLELHRPVVHPRVTRFGYENLRKYHISKQEPAHELTIDKTMLELVPWHFDALRAITVMEEQAKVLGKQGAADLQNIMATILALPDSTLVCETAGDDGENRIGPHGSGDYITLADMYELGSLELWQTFQYFSIDEAVARADTFITHHPALPHGYEMKGRVLFFKNSYDSAHVYTDRAIAIDPSRARPYFFRANLAFMQNAFDSARADLLRSLECDSLYYIALNGLSIVLEQHSIGPADTLLAASTIRRLQQFIKNGGAKGVSPQMLSQAQGAIARTEKAWAAIRNADRGMTDSGQRVR